jgi:hypothetical protein
MEYGSRPYFIPNRTRLGVRLESHCCLATLKRMRPIALALLRPARLRRTLTRSAPGTALFHCEPSQHKEVSTLSKKIVVEFAPTSLAARTSTLSPPWFIFSWGDGARLTADLHQRQEESKQIGRTDRTVTIWHDPSSSGCTEYPARGTNRSWLGLRGCTALCSTTPRASCARVPQLHAVVVRSTSLRLALFEVVGARSCAILARVVTLTCFPLVMSVAEMSISLSAGPVVQSSVG